MKTLLLILLTFSLNAQGDMLKKAEGKILSSKILIVTGSAGMVGSILYWRNPPDPPYYNPNWSKQEIYAVSNKYYQQYQAYKTSRVVLLSASGAMILMSGYLALSGSLEKQIYNAGRYTVGVNGNGISLTF